MTYTDAHHFESVKDLRTTLVELLAPELGTFANGLASIWVEDEDCPPSTDGVLCVIAPYTAVQSSQILLNHGVLDIVEWVVTLRSFGTKQQFRSAIDKMRRRFPIRLEVILPYKEGVRMQASFRIKDAHIGDTRLY